MADSRLSRFFTRQSTPTASQAEPFAVLLEKPQKVPKGFQGLEVLPDGSLVQWLDDGRKLKASQNGQLWLVGLGPWSLNIVPQPQHAPELGVNVGVELVLNDNLVFPQFLAQQKTSLDVDELTDVIKEISGTAVILPSMTVEEQQEKRSELSLNLQIRTGLQCTHLASQSLVGKVTPLATELLTRWQAAKIQIEAEPTWQVETQETASTEAPQTEPTSADFDDLSGLAVELGLSPKRYPSQWWKPTALDEALRHQVSRSLDIHSVTLMEWRREETEKLSDEVWQTCRDLEDEMRLTAQQLVVLPSLNHTQWSYRKRRQIAGLIREVKDRENDIASQLNRLTLTSKGSADNNTAEQAPEQTLEKINELLANLQMLLQQRRDEVIS